VRVPLDGKFLATALLTLLVLVPVIILLSKFVGPEAATVAGTVIGAVAVKLFDKLDYEPTFNLELGAPNITAPWFLAATASVFLLYGCDISARVAIGLFERFSTPLWVCTWWALLTLVLLDWGGYALAGWTIGRLFSARALAYSSIAALSLVLASLASAEFGVVSSRSMRLLACLVGGPVSPEIFEGFTSGSRLGYVVAVIARGYFAITMARIASKSKLKQAASGGGAA
jgi:hypothetical protein